MKRVGYKIVAYDSNRYYSLQSNATINGEIGSIITHPQGIYLGASEEFVKDYYTGLTDDIDILMTYEFDEQDIIKNNGSEILVRQAMLKNKQVLPKQEDFSFAKWLHHEKLQT